MNHTNASDLIKIILESLDTSAQTKSFFLFCIMYHFTQGETMRAFDRKMNTINNAEIEMISNTD